MPTQTALREGPVTTADTRTAISGLGASSSPGLMKTPSDKHRIAYLIVAVAAETPTTTTQGGVFFLRIGGDALDEEYVFMLGGDVSQLATSGETGGPGFVVALEVDLPLKKPGEYLEIFGEHAGVDASDPNIMVAPIYE